MQVFYLLVQGLLNNSISSSEYVVSNGRTIRKWRIGKGVVGNGRSVIWGPTLAFVWRESKAFQETQIIWDEYEKGVLITPHCNDV